MTTRNEREAIAASAEAKTHPEMAMAAVRTGMTLAQFQRMARAADAGPAESALARVVLAVGTHSKVKEISGAIGASGNVLDVEAIYERRRQAVKSK